MSSMSVSEASITPKNESCLISTQKLPNLSERLGNFHFRVIFHSPHGKFLCLFYKAFIVFTHGESSIRYY